MSVIQAQRRLTGREIGALKYLARCGVWRPVTLPPHLREPAIALWHLGLVDVWLRQQPRERPAPNNGSFFSLTVSGSKLASSFLANRRGETAPAASARKPRRPKMKIRDFDPRQPGQGFQGDVSIVPIPLDLAVHHVDEMLPKEGRLILQEGEATGHHHAIYLLANIPKFHDAALARDMFAKAAGGSAKLYRDPTVAPEMVRRGILTRADLAVACLIVDGGPMVVSHQEHEGIRLPPGKYLIGRQVESAGAEERMVQD